MVNIQIIRPETHDLKKISNEMKVENWEVVDKSFTEENVEKFTKNPDHFFLLAYIDNHVAGMLVAYNLQKLDSRNKEMFLYEVETKPQFRRKGVGKALIEKLYDIAKKEGSHEVWVPTDEDNLPANKLYGSLKVKTNKQDSLAMYDYPIDNKNK